MDENLNTGDINPAEGETAVTPPGDTQTTQTGVANSDQVAATTEEESRSIPYERFKEVNERYRQTEEKLKALEQQVSSLSVKPTTPEEEQVKSTLKQYGFVSQDEVRQEVRRVQEDIRVEQELSQLETRYDGKDGRPKFDRQRVLEFAINRNIADPEVAYKALNEKTLIDWHIAQASKASIGVKSERSDGSGAGSPGPSNDDLLKAAQQGDDGAFDSLIRRSSAFKRMFSK